MSNDWTILKLIEWTADFFAKHGVPNPRLDAELLLAHVLNKKRIELYLTFDHIVKEGDLATFKGYIQRRTRREPLQYIVGTQDFCGVPIKVAPAVLIPRPETELLVEQVLKLIVASSGDPTILDLCTGSGCIIAALAGKLPNAHFTGVDISDAALEVARQNTERRKERVELLCGNLFEPLRSNDFTISRSYELIVSNPPYVAESEWPSLQPEIRDFEPKEALVAGNDSLAIIKEIINNAYNFLKPDGWLVMEIGDGQAGAVKELIANTEHYNEAAFVKDYGGIERIVAMQITNNQIPRYK